MLSKTIKSLAAVKGIDAAEITQEQVDAINTDFAALGLGGVEVTGLGALAEIQSQANESAAAVTLLTAELATANESITAKDAELTTLKAGAKTATEEAAATAKTALEASQAETAKFKAEAIKFGAKIPKDGAPTPEATQDDVVDEGEENDFSCDADAELKAARAKLA